MADEIIVYKNRRNIVKISLGYDVSGDTFVGEIRAKAAVESVLIATWMVSFETDGTDGALILTLDDSETPGENIKTGYTDLIRISGGEPYAALAEPIKVVFKDTVTEWTP